MKKSILIAFVVITLVACQPKKEKVDQLIYNATIITMNDSQAIAQTMAIKNGKIIAIGDSNLLNQYDCEKENKIDAKGQFIYPGLIDAHCHFFGYAKTLLTCDLVGTNSWESTVQKIHEFGQMHPEGWLSGRGWDQNDWLIKEFPNNDTLNKMYPDRPVVLKRIDGHAVICNQKALDLAGINLETKVFGGEILKNGNKLSGILIDNAVDLIQHVIPNTPKSSLVNVLQKAEKECYSYGLTTLADAGLELRECLLLDSLIQQKQLSIFLYLMLNPKEDGFSFAKTKGIYENDGVRIGSFKLYSDGSLGSRGARLKQSYCDRVHHSGLLIQSPSYYDSIVKMIYNETKYQVNTHCIGDSANNLILEAYSKVLPIGNDRRWRIEHAQIVDLKDIYKFNKYSIIPSVQPTHATSDGPWVKDRICEDRMLGAYAYKSLLNQNNYLALGTDFPVEYLQPLYTFYSAVFRKSAQRKEDNSFLIGERLSPLEALKGMTIWAAKACQLEHRKGQLAIGMDADFVIMDKNILETNEVQTLNTQILSTYKNGSLVFKKENTK